MKATPFIILTLLTSAVGAKSYAGESPSPTDETALKASCDSKDAKACAMLGQRYVEQHKSSSAIPFLELACSAKIGQGCFYLAIAYDEAGHSSEVLATLKKACELGDEHGCTGVKEYAKHQAPPAPKLPPDMAGLQSGPEGYQEWYEGTSTKGLVYLRGNRFLHAQFFGLYQLWQPGNPF